MASNFLFSWPSKNYQRSKTVSTQVKEVRKVILVDKGERTKMVGSAQARSCNERCCQMSLIHQSSAGEVRWEFWWDRLSWRCDSDRHAMLALTADFIGVCRGDNIPEVSRRPAKMARQQHAADNMPCRRKAHIKRMRISCTPARSSWRKLWASISVWNVAMSLWILIGWGPTLKRKYAKGDPISAFVGAVLSGLLMNRTDHTNDTSRRDAKGSPKRHQSLLLRTSSTTICSWQGGWKWNLKLQKMSYCIKNVVLRQKSILWRKRTKPCSVGLRSSSKALIKFWSLNEISVSSFDRCDMTLWLNSMCCLFNKPTNPYIFSILLHHHFLMECEQV